MGIIKSLSELIPEGGLKEKLRLYLHWCINSLKFVKKEVRLYDA